MDKEKFLGQIMEILDTENELTDDTLLSSFSSWDSMSAMNIMLLLEEMDGISIDFDEMMHMTTIGDVLKKAGF